MPSDLPLIWNPRLTSTAGQVVDDGSKNAAKTKSGQYVSEIYFLIKSNTQAFEVQHRGPFMLCCASVTLLVKAKSSILYWYDSIFLMVFEFFGDVSGCFLQAHPMSFGAVFEDPQHHGSYQGHAIT